MRVIDATEVDRLVDMASMIEAMRRAFLGAIVEPLRHRHAMGRRERPDATLLLMPAWTNGRTATDEAAYAGVKIVTVSPDNSRHGQPSVLGTYVLMSGLTGAPLAVIDGEALTLRRTAATSGLAAAALARPDARRHLVVGAGALSPFLAAAMAVVREVTETLIWNRTPERAESVAAALRLAGMTAHAVTDLEAAAGRADIVSAATLSQAPLVLGRWLRPGTHLDLVGAFSPAMRETDDEAVRRARVFVDTREGALTEGGDLVQAIAAGAMAPGDVAGDLAELTGGRVAGRRSQDEITLFKSVGAAREDLFSAVLVYERCLAREAASC